MAVRMDTGKVLWSMQALPLDVWHNGCPQTIPGGRAGRASGARRRRPARCRAAGCRTARRGGHAAAASRIRRKTVRTPPVPTGTSRRPRRWPRRPDGRDIIIAPQKQGLVWALNPDNGAVLWKQDVAREIAGGRGETLFGGAIDHEKAYFGLVSGAHLALDLKTGEELWYCADQRPAGRENKRGIVGAVTLIPGVLLSGAGDGVVRAVSSKTGQLLWQFDTAQEFTTVNGVAAHGGSLASGGPTVANGMVFIGSGYPGFQGGDPGNVLAGVCAGRAARCLRRRVEEALGPRRRQAKRQTRCTIALGFARRRSSDYCRRLSAQGHPSHVIRNGPITARVYLPEARGGLYRSTRFDWSGAIASSNTKDTVLRQLVHEDHRHLRLRLRGPKDDVISAEFTAMVGPAEEFGVIGYNDAKPGGLFVKPGVGVLRRADDTAYNHSKPYKIANGGKWDVEAPQRLIEFTHTLNEPAIDFGYVYTKIIRLTRQAADDHRARAEEHRQEANPDQRLQPQLHDPRQAAAGTRLRDLRSRSSCSAPSEARGRDGRAGGGPAPAGAAGHAGQAAAGRRQRAAAAEPAERLACGQPQMQALAAPQGNRLVYTKALEGVECFQASFTGFGSDGRRP